MLQVAGVLLVQGGKYVVQKRDHRPGIANPGMHSPWGGGVEALESPEQAAVRELYEETGVKITEDDLIFLTQLSVKGQSERSKGQIVDCFLYAAEISEDVAVHCYEGERLVRINGLADLPEEEYEGFLKASIESYEQQKSQSK